MIWDVRYPVPKSSGGRNEMKCDNVTECEMKGREESWMIDFLFLSDMVIMIPLVAKEKLREINLLP